MGARYPIQRERIMRVTLVSHASTVIETQDVRIWTDPWLFGKAFNDSWSLLVPAAFEPAMLDGIDYLWISHEHPDHFHIPTLRSLPDSFKQRVTLLFQDDSSDKMFAAFEKLGFPNHMRLPHRKIVRIGDDTEVYCHQVGQMDSALGVRSGGKIVFNINDCEMNKRDCQLVRRDLGAPDVVLNQFSCAGYNGEPDLRKLASLGKRILRNVCENSRDLGASATIPIASFAYFSTTDNRYINRYANSPRQCAVELEASGERAVVLYPGDSWEVGKPHDSNPALEKFDIIYDSLDELTYDAPDQVPLQEIASCFARRAADLRTKYPLGLLRRLKPLHVRVPDLALTVRIDIACGTLEVATGVEPDLEIMSQPLDLCFRVPFGIQTLGVSARSRLLKNHRLWKLYRILFSAYNAEVYLSPRYLFSPKNARYLASRLWGALNQLRYQLARMNFRLDDRVREQPGPDRKLQPIRPSISVPQREQASFNR
jgi:UDP-MurNAc hydroxylase